MPEVFDALRALPCGRRLLQAASGRAGIHLVGGAVRDLLLGREPRELDVAVEGDVGDLAGALGAMVAAHERFGTATVEAGDGCRIDLAATRAESYAAPGALPDVRPAGIEEDLARRDFTVNALALDLASGALREAPGARADLRAGLLRVLHDASFRDDPTRLWRMVRYGVRLGFAAEAGTAELARAAVAGGALGTVSGARIGNELRLALREADPVAVLEAAAALGLAGWLAPDRVAARDALALLPAGEGRPDLVVLAASVADPAALDGLGFTAAEREVVQAGARAAELAGRARAATRPSELVEVFARAPVEAVALAGARGARPEALRYLGELRRVRLEITGDDLVAAGVPQGPEVGRRLAHVRAGRLDGEIAPGRDAELAAALGRSKDRGSSDG